MAQAQVVLTAVDRTQVAINSALRGMKTLERTAKLTSKAINIGFGLLTGTVLLGTFKKITDAAQKTSEGRRAVEKFNEALKDPALVSAANAFTTAMVRGFTEVVSFGTKAIKTIGDVGKQLGLIDDFSNIDRSQLTGERGGRRGKRMVIDPVKSQIQQWQARQNALKLTEQREKEAAEAAKKLAQEMSQLNKMTMTSIEKTVAEMNEFSAAVDRLVKAGLITRDIATSRMAEKLEDVLGEVEVTGKRNIIEANREPIDRMTEFAKQAAQSIQSSFADFLFDPFQNGLKGMLSGFLTVIRRMLAEVAASAILKSVFGQYQGKGGFLGAVAGALLTRASGGPVMSNTPYIVGERGPELFVPGTSGGIMPNNRLANMGGGVTVAPVYNIDARGATADLQKALPGILQENNRRIFDELDRRYGIGR